MKLVPQSRLVVWGAVGLASALLGLLLARLTLAELAVSALLRKTGASEITLHAVRVSPWRVELEDISFQFRTQTFAAGRATMVRAHWWTPSLGIITVEKARVPVTIDGSDTNPREWATYQNGTVSWQPAWLPVERIVLGGQLLVRAAALTEQALTVRVEAHQVDAGGHWQGTAEMDGTGLKLRADGAFDPAKDELGFHLRELTLDLQSWQNFVQRLVVLPGGSLELGGRIRVNAEGRFTGKAPLATGSVQWHDGQVKNALRGVAAEGVEAELEFVDFGKCQTKPGTLRVRELRAGQLVMRNLNSEFALASANQITVTRATLDALGGSLAAEPFNCFIDQRELEAVLVVEGIDVAEVMALTQDLPAKASGRVNGRLPLRIDGSGLRLGTGWLALKPGVYAEVRLNAGGLLTGGLSTNSPSYAVLKKIESGLLKLKINEMRLEVRPPDAPPGRSAQLHLVGEPVDPEVKAPVTLDLNVNGPIEKLLNLGIDSRVNFGAEK